MAMLWRIFAAATISVTASHALTAQDPAASSSNFMVFFDWGKPDVRSDDAAVLDQVAAIYRAHSGAQLQLSGNTDRSGSVITNRRAGLRRAETVRAQLIARGVPASAISVASYGEDRPLVPTEDGVREVQNRRVEIAVVGVMVPATAAAPTAASGMLVPFPIRGPNGEARGIATFFSDGQRTTIKVVAEGLPAGVHGIHLHAIGRCDGPDFKSAGPHWNPAGKQHGHDNPLGAHLGDLPNLTIGADGRGSASFAIQGDMADTDGTALVIHAKPDDEKTDPSGNSGDRIACAVLVAPASGGASGG
jgi:Cu-Zn family superoxide dismutase